MRVGVVGINHKLADLKLLERLAKACQKLFGAFHTFHGNHSFILLSTCNRTEIYFSSEDLAITHTYLLSLLRQEVDEEFDHKLYSYFGVDCFSHLARVTLGLDSAIIAETEIQGQVKVAYEGAADCHPLPKELHFLFQRALGISKKIRSELKLGKGMPNLEHAVLHVGKCFFKSPEKMRLLFIGASEINQKIMSFLKSKNFNMTLCNRSQEPAQYLASTYGLQLMAWDQLSSWHDYDWIIFGTKSPDYLIKQQNFPSGIQGQKLIMDLCVPRNVEPKLGQDPRVTLLNIYQMNRLLRIRHRWMAQTLAEAEQRVLLATQQQINRYHQREQSKIALLA